MIKAEDFLAELEIKSGADLGSDLGTDLGTDLSSNLGLKPNKQNKPANDEPDSLSGSSDIQGLKKQIENRAVALLAQREHGAKELQQKLLKKFPETPEILAEYNEVRGFLSDLINDVIELCQANNWQSDDRYLEQAVHSYMAKGHGPMKIKQKLQTACSNSELIDAHLSIDEADWVEEARSALIKKYGDNGKPTEQKEQARRMRFLQSRGFFPSTIWKAFD